MSTRIVFEYEMTLTQSQAQDVIQIIGASGKMVAVLEWGVCIKGGASSDPLVNVTGVLETNAGSGGSAITGLKLDSADPSASVTAAGGITTAPTPTATPGGGANFAPQYVSANGGAYTWGSANAGPMVLRGTERFGIRATPGTLTGTVKATAYAIVQEI